MATVDEKKKRDAAAALLANPPVNTFQGRALTPAQLAQPIVAAPAIAAPVAQQTLPVPGTRSPFAAAAQAAGMVDQAALAAQGRINNTTGPGSNDAETMRRIEIAQGGNRGSPSARAALTGALMGQLSGSRAAAAGAVAPTGVIAGNAAEAEAAAALAAQTGQQDMAKQALIGQQSNANLTLQQTAETGRNNATIAGAIEQTKIGQQAKPAYQRGADGALALVDGGVAKTVVGADGAAFVPQDQAGEITSADRFKAYQERAAAITTALISPEQKAAQQAALQSDPLFAPLFAAQTTAAAGTTAPMADAAKKAIPPPQGAIDLLKGAPTDQNIAFFERRYGAGSAAQYLGK